MKNYIVLIALILAFAKAYPQESENTTVEDIIFYYDVSYSMRDRNLNVEIDFIDTYFQKHPEARVTLYQMSTALNDASKHTVTDGDWSSIKEVLTNTEYDGASDFSVVDFTQKVTGFLLSTDGELSISKLPKGGDVPITTINTIRKDEGSLRWLSQSSGGIYEEGIGKKGTKKIKVKTPRAKAKRVSTPQSKDNELDAVTIQGYGTDEGRKEYNTIDIGGVKYDKKKLGYSVEKITDKEISQLDVDAKQAVNGQFAGIKVTNNSAITRTDLSQFKGRHDNMSLLGDQTGLIVIDGVPQAKANSAGGRGSFYDIDNSMRKGNAATINPDNIKSITVLKGLAATNRYGSLGKGGVIEIVTKSVAGSSAGKSKKKEALGTTPTYTGTANLMNDLPNTEYLNALKETSEINEALDVYLKYRDSYGDDPEFFLNVARYFKGWKKPEITSRILSNVSEVAANDIVTLRALSYVYEDTRDYTSQVALLEHILDLDEKNAQSYLDLARANALAGDYEKSLDFYNKIILPQGLNGVNFSGVKDAAIKEYKYLVVSKGQKIKMSKVYPAYRKAPEKVARRIVVEYSDPEALFDLKIINPQNRFFTWSHTTTGEAARLTQEKQQGFNQEEFFLTDTDKGQWRFNVINYGAVEDRALASTFLKITIFKNWGSANQSREVKLVQLSELNKEEQVLSVNI